MKIKLYLPYYSIYDDGDFDVSNDYYKSNDDYLNAVANSIANTRNAVVDYVENGATSVYKSTDGQMYQFGNKMQQNQNEVAYAQCDAMMIDSKGNDLSVDSFISDYVGQDPQLYIFNLDLDSSDEEFEQELNLWNRDHAEIQKYSKLRGDEWVLDNEPKRDLIIEFKNNANEIKKFTLKNATIMEKQHINSYVMLVDTIEMNEKK